MKRVLLYLIVLHFSLGAGATLISMDAARTIAQNVYYERASNQFPVIYESISFSGEFSILSGQTPAIYIFNVSESKGWILISAESNAYPVLAYSKKGSYIPEQMPPAFEWWIENYRAEIQSIRDNNSSVTTEASEAWQRYSVKPILSTAKVVTIGPIIQTRWNQGDYYNDNCPGGSVTGCVATAMAQVLRYWSHPKTGKGSYTYTHPTYGPLSADFGNTTYNWANMPTVVSAPNADVAKLMFHCGVSVEMNYSPSGSGANMGMAASAFPTYFRYTYFTRQANKNNYDDIYWCINIRSNLIDSRPVMYAGGAHAFVCDGFEYPDHFHFNMGWGGSGDGYFYISSVGPGGNYTSSQTAILDLYPLEESLTSMGDAGATPVMDNLDLYIPQGLEGAMAVSPNPVQNEFRLSVNSQYKGALTLTVRDNAGRVQKVISLDKGDAPQAWELSLEGLASGFYFLELSNQSERIVERVVKY